MATEKQIAANRANALLSTGPKTAAGRARSAMNSYRDGMRSKKRKALRDESYVAESRKHKWMATSDPCNDIAEFLMHQSVCASFELEHAVRVNLERSTKLVENSDDKEIDAVGALGRRLFHDRCGPTGAYGNVPHVRTKEDLKRQTSSSGAGDDPDHPAKLVAELEKTAPGCIWMREQWEELREQVNRDVFQSIDRLRATRLLGCQPADIAFDQYVAVIFIASAAVDPAGKTEVDDLLSDLREEQLKRLRRRLHKRWPELFEFEVTVPAFKQALGELIDEQIERLQAMVEEFKTNADEAVQTSVAESKLDQTPEAYRLLNYVVKARRELRLGLAAFEKYNKGLGRAVSLGIRSRTGPHPGPLPEGEGGSSGSSSRMRQEEGERTAHRGRGAAGGKADVDLSWAYEDSALGDSGAKAGAGADGGSARELARIDVMLDTVLSDGVVDGDGAIGSGGEGHETGEAEAGIDLHDGDAVAGGDSAIEGPDIPATESVAGETSEPNFDEDVINAENEYPVDVATNFGAFSRLDKGVAKAEGGPRRTEDGGRGARAEDGGRRTEDRTGLEGGGSEGVGGVVVEGEICGASLEVGDARSGIENPTSQRSSSGPRPRSP
jgi:hypothetical protein